jgi:hypothetical protein
MRTNFYRAWLWRMPLPQNVLRYFLTPFSRSDLMAGVFDATLFSGATFTDLNEGGDDPPRASLFINATDAVPIYNGDGRKVVRSDRGFVFTQEAFAAMSSRLDTYPVSYAVMASAAFPGVFHSVPLEFFAQRPVGAYGGTRTFRHLFDGGAVDNLGISTLVDVARLSPDAQLGCLLIVADADSGDARRFAMLSEHDTRNLTDLLFDRNAIVATEVLQEFRKTELLRGLGISEDGVVGMTPAVSTATIPDSEPPLECIVWRLSFDRLLTLMTISGKNPGSMRLIDRWDSYYGQLYELATSFETHFKLTTIHDCTIEQGQQVLLDAAHVLVAEDAEALSQVCDWASGHGLKIRCSTNGLPEPTKRRPPCFYSMESVRKTDVPWFFRPDESGLRELLPAP